MNRGSQISGERSEIYFYSFEYFNRVLGSVTFGAVIIIMQILVTWMSEDAKRRASDGVWSEGEAGGEEGGRKEFCQPMHQ